MHCSASEDQTYTGTWLFGVESWKSLKGQENLLLKNLQLETRVENVRFLSWGRFFVGKYGIHSPNEMAFKRAVTLRVGFRFPAIRFDAPKLLSFSGFTNSHAKCPPVLLSLRKNGDYPQSIPNTAKQMKGVWNRDEARSPSFWHVF